MSKTDKSDSSHAILDKASRQRKAQKIVRVLGAKKNLKKSKVLDIGTGAGYIAEHLAKHAKDVTSVDLVDERKVKENYTFVKVADESLPFKEGHFDIVISNHVVEHVGDQQQHIDEIIRVLKPGGIIYLATPNKNWITDPHYRVPLINWMPPRLASRYLRTLKGKTWDIKPVNVRKLKRLSKNQHRIDSLVVEIIKQPEQYHLDAFKKLHPVTRRMPRPVLKALSSISPTVLILLTKSEK
jgi:ubiquinone/menaquinone biosynthesis C-methylase UbiE